ncbi:MAG: PqqD family protein [Paludibacteraceae bacterium]|nr:PqqD family protein [Paludibacteraceae bacterium]
MKINANIAISQSGYIFNPQTGESFSLNPIGVEVIRMLQEEKPKETIVASIVDRYDVTASAFACDLDDFVSLLKQYEMLTDE